MNDAFYNAAVFGDMDELCRMTESDPSLVNSRDELGFAVLHTVVGEEQFEAADYLLDKGADVNASNFEGITPLHLAANPEMVEILVRRGAEVDARSNDGRTPLLVHAAEAGRCEVMKALLKFGADPQAKDQSGDSALDIARLREEGDKIALLEKYDV